MEYDTTYVPINDAYYRRFFIPVLIATVLFLGAFLIIRGAPGMELETAKALQFGGKFGGKFARRVSKGFGLI